MNGFHRYILICLLLLGTLIPTPAWSNPANRQAFVRYFGEYLPANLNSCSVCHVGAHAEGAESLEDFPHNPFGNQLRLEADKLLKAERDPEIDLRLKLLSEADADNDGFSNLQEILFGTAPGDKTKFPDAKAAEKLKQLTADFTEYKNRYAWKPFKPVTRPEVPLIKDADWARNPIDHFIAAGHEQEGLQRAKEASPEILLRRVYLDLIGLNPTPAEIQDFLKEQKTNPQAYEEIVTRLLNHPAYGERWGRHWMDVWRYSDWAGYKQALRESQRHIWHWRDWIIESLNADKGYDQMLVEMLAADELKPDDWDTLRATGYLARNYHSKRDQWMDDVVKHTSQAFLGITVGCAKCHDHMYDEIEQREYYEMRAIFETYHVRTDRVEGVLDTAKNGIPRAYDKSLTAKTWLFEKGDERRPVKEEIIPPGVPTFLGGEFKVTPVSLPMVASQPARRESVKEDLLTHARKMMEQAKAKEQRLAAESELAVLEAQFDIEEMEASGDKKSDAWKAAALKLVKLQRQSALENAKWKLMAAEQEQQEAQQAVVTAEAKKKKSVITKAKQRLKKAEQQHKAAQTALKKAETDSKAKLTTKYTPRKQPVYPKSSSGRRLAFARWLTDGNNPLTARVAMNHIWLRHFGQPIVPTVNEFGGNGRGPTHPALIDWLAAELVKQDWSMKEMHRLIVTSSTYRMAGTGSEENSKIDPDNKYLWKKSSMRMEGEIVRDNLLFIPGRLDPQLGGPDIDNTKAQDSVRKSIYLRHAHEKLVEFVQIFDGPSVSECYMRDMSVQPHQALAMANSKLTFQATQALTEKLLKQTSGNIDDFIQQAFLSILSRSPDASEQKMCHEFLTHTSESSKIKPSEDQFQLLVTVLFNHNDFVTIR
ncbi:DUF1549 and DUF1553 domain-containing protein [Gimesia algae]|uniref:Planctomycete cytochrome C n=1 Tax=Gimesia algae TaxID=2527971 RepID=A0A517VF69_9PLAN|nr:DUF1553 domain-containing protein [Gimesia algae]QDT91652.1 hypothetical protein Pan161_33140 [Gimesia algae]